MTPGPIFTVFSALLEVPLRGSTWVDLLLHLLSWRYLLLSQMHLSQVS